MPKTFNPQTVIEAYNKKNSRQLSPTKTWGLTCLEPEMIAFFQATERHLNQLTSARSVVEETAKRVQHYSASLKYLKKITAEQIADTQQPLIDTVVARMQWENTVYQQLTDKQSWQRVKSCENPSAQAETALLNELAYFWQYPELHLQSNDTLYSIFLLTTHTLPHLRAAQRAITASWRLPKPVKAALQQSLKALETQFRRRQTQALHTMQARLAVARAVAGETGKWQGDIVAYTAQQLNRLGSPLVEKPLYPYKYTLNASHFRAFHNAIATHDEATLPQALSQSLGFGQETQPIPTTTLTLDNEHLLVPQALQAHVPTWRGWPAWLFAGRHARAQFFRDQQFTIARVTLPLPVMAQTTALTYEAQRIFFNALQRHEDVIEEALKKARSAPVSRWQWGYKDLVNDWQKLLEQRRYACTLKHLELLEAILNQPFPPDEAACTLSWQLVHGLVLKLEQAPLSEWAQKRFVRLNKRIAALAGDPIVYIRKQIHLLARGTVLKPHDQAALREMLEMMCLGQEHPVFADPTLCQPAAEHLLTALKPALEKKNVDAEALIHTGKLILLLGNKKTQQHLFAAVEEMLIRQAQTVITADATNLAIQADRLKNLVEALGSEGLKIQYQTLHLYPKHADGNAYKKAYVDLTQRLACIHTDHYVQQETERVNRFFTHTLTQQVIGGLPYTAGLEAQVRQLGELPDCLVQQKTTRVADLKETIEASVNKSALEYFEKTTQGKAQGDRPRLRAVIEATAASRLFRARLKAATTLQDKNALLDNLQREVHPRTPHTDFFRKRYSVPLFPIPLSHEVTTDELRPTI